jgi:hypothetical protein
MGAFSRSLVVVLVAIVAGTAWAEEGTFEQALDAAQPAGDLAARLDPLFADCKRDDDLDARQCATVRDAMLERLQAGTFVANGDESALTFSPWSAAEHQLTLEIQGCLACGKPLAIGDRQRFITTRVPKAIKAGKAVGLDVGFHGVPLRDADAAAKWVKETLPRLRVQFVFRVGPVWHSGVGDKTYEGVTFVPVAHRVYDRCTGKVWGSEPPSQSPKIASAREADCPESDAERAAREPLPEQLSRQQVVRAMRAIESKIHDCFVEFETNGTATVRLVVQGDGRVDQLNVLAPFDHTPTGYCVKTAVQQGLSLPRFAGAKMTITYPFMLR